MTLVGRVLPLSRDAVSVFYSPNRLGKSLRVNETQKFCNIKILFGQNILIVSVVSLFCLRLSHFVVIITKN